MKLVLALICGLLVLLGAESASAGPGKGVKTFLVPAPVVEVKPLPPKCVAVERKVVSVESGQLYSVPSMLFESCGCCGTSQTYMPGVTYYRPEQQISGVVITTDCK